MKRPSAAWAREATCVILALGSVTTSMACGNAVELHPAFRKDAAPSSEPAASDPREDASLAADDPAGDAGASVAIGGGPYDHRPRAVACGPTAQPDAPPQWGPGECQRHEDCQEQDFGRCSENQQCFYDQCWTDEDCGPGMLCSCPDHPDASFNYAICVPAGCRTDSDCAGDAHCRPSVDLFCGHGMGGYFCPTPQDECAEDADCSERAHCAYDGEAERWVCSDRYCVLP